ncbi:peptidoglycan-associated lipoprotein Pal [Massilia sp. PAMC28688]|uniref:peptidoglycan-associated lipoprotein Pal n=1 Tax=Massilia sp. PAMC28688 TaxID=2861283 RepID=UPI001C63433B|nr:peptidoglycan-associated lipoprotein Pal [Massilia sp. PAMC28688]QYF92642.1 peptidoglycan-associated lipoprotein Pal [Massilia sp. PAMC28688]
MDAKILGCVMTALALAACSSPVKLNDPAPAPAAAAPAPAPQAGVAAPVAAGAVDPLADPQGVLAKRSVYFDYDSYVVQDAGRSVVSNHGNYLSANKGRRVVIQGHTDERGGTEYNLALGQKRAEAVRQSLLALGVAPAQMEAVSMGESKPAATGSGEEVWAKNRRADIVY